MTDVGAWICCCNGPMKNGVMTCCKEYVWCGEGEPTSLPPKYRGSGFDEDKKMDRPYLCREWLIEDARDAVLAALDKFASASGLPNLPEKAPGATDADLPALFKGIDAQVDALIARAGVTIPDEPYPEDVVQEQRNKLARALAEGAA